LRILASLISLAALWLLLSGFFTPLQLGFGAMSCAFTLWLTVRLGLLRDDNLRLRVAARSPRYVVWLTWEIVKSNLHVARVILSPRMPLHRQVVHLNPTQRSGVGIAVYANSITLTPGTLTMDAENRVLEVHALTTAVADDLRSGEMDRRVTRLEGD
jgi:multicomponent Na+:H+ antiporter subunit E